MKNLGEILRDIDVLHSECDMTTTITGVTVDSRKVQKGMVYVAIKGTALDGHDFVNAALKNGAVCAVCERDIPGTVVRVRDTRNAYALAQKVYHNKVDQKLSLFGVTGTNGKTTTTNMIRAILNMSGVKTGVIGTLGYKYNNVEKKLNHTTPESGEIYDIFELMYGDGVKAIAMEVSSHALAQKRVFGIDFDIGVFTNLTQDHLDYHRDMEDYFRAKCLLFENLSDNQRITTNIDDPYGRRIFKEYHGSHSFGIDSPDADFRAVNLYQNAEGSTFDIEAHGEVYPIRLDAPARFNVMNALAAFTAVVSWGMNPEIAASGLSSYTGTKGRFEKISGGHPFTVIVDYAHTPDALERVTKEAESIADGRLIVVFGAGGDRDSQKRPIMGEIVANSADVIIVTSDNPRTEDPDSIIADIIAGVPNGVEYVREPDRRKAIKTALDHATAGDVVLIAGKGHEDYQIIGTEKIYFDDAFEVVQWLSERGYR